jgi:hypothetical protein
LASYFKNFRALSLNGCLAAGSSSGDDQQQARPAGKKGVEIGQKQGLTGRITPVN